MRARTSRRVLWTAGESIDLLVQRVGEPVDREEFFVDLSAAPAPKAVAATACSNCGAGGPLTACAASHELCGDCVMRCSTCSRVVCSSCGERACPTCNT